MPKIKPTLYRMETLDSFPVRYRPQLEDLKGRPYYDILVEVTNKGAKRFVWGRYYTAGYFGDKATVIIPQRMTREGDVITHWTSFYKFN